MTGFRVLDLGLKKLDEKAKNMCILALLGAEGFGVEDGQFATEVYECVLVAGEEEEETTDRKSVV